MRVIGTRMLNGGKQERFDVTCGKRYVPQHIERVEEIYSACEQIHHCSPGDGPMRVVWSGGRMTVRTASGIIGVVIAPGDYLCES